MRLTSEVAAIPPSPGMIGRFVACAERCFSAEGTRQETDYEALCSDSKDERGGAANMRERIKLLRRSNRAVSATVRGVKASAGWLGTQHGRENKIKERAHMRHVRFPKGRRWVEAFSCAIDWAR